MAGVYSLVDAQESVGMDTVFVHKDKKVHSPRKATLYSAVLPGLGQIYNRKYWKLPLIYGGFVGFGWAIAWNNDQYVLYKQAYSDISDDDPETNSHLDIEAVKYYNMNSASDVAEFGDKLEQAKDGARRYRDMNIIFTAAFYALNIIDASVDAHFFDFDISDDLSMTWGPGPMYCLNQKMIGIHCRIEF